jgi:hypothetical protein
VTISLVPTQPTQPPSFTRSSFTDTSGFIEFKNLVDGVYNVRVEREGYTPAQNSDRTSVFLRQGSQRFTLEMQMRRKIDISGRVLKTDGSPLAKAHVSPMLLDYSNGRRTFIRVSLTIAGGRSPDVYTDDKGEFRFEGLPAGAYYLRVDSAGFALDDRERDARVTYYPGVARSAEAIPVNPRGQDASGIDIRIPDTARFTISGVVSGLQNIRRPDGTEAPPAANGFYLVSADADNLDSAEILYLPNVSTENAGESRFELRGVAPGSYFLTAIHRPERSTLLSRVPLIVKDRDLRDVRLPLRPIPELKGRIVMDGGDSSAFRQGAVLLVFFTKERLPALIQDPRNGTPVGPTGEFTFTELAEDVPYVLNGVYGLPEDAYVSDIRQGGLSIFNNGAAIRSNPLDGPVEIRVMRQGGAVQGNVRDTLGQGLRLSVVLVPSAPHRDNPVLYKETQTDESGRFVIRGVMPGEYKLFSWPQSPRGRAYLSERFLADYESRGVSVRVNPGMASDVQVNLLQLPQ